MDYRVLFVAARVNAVLIASSALLAADAVTPLHPSWLTADFGLTCGVLAGVFGAVAAVLPQVQRTPSARENAYLSAATDGVLPSDLQTKHPYVLDQVAAQKQAAAAVGVGPLTSAPAPPTILPQSGTI